LPTLCGTQQTLLGLAVFWFSACNLAQLDFTQQPTRTLASVSPAPDGQSGNKRRERAILSLFKDWEREREETKDS
jgi:hypothetical protein